jgi:hypothetical protein
VLRAGGQWEEKGQSHTRGSDAHRSLPEFGVIVVADSGGADV